MQNLKGCNRIETFEMLKKQQELEKREESRSAEAIRK